MVFGKNNQRNLDEEVEESSNRWTKDYIYMEIMPTKQLGAGFIRRGCEASQNIDKHCI